MRRRALIAVVAALALAAGVLYIYAWPFVLTGPRPGTSDNAAFACTADAPTQIAHAVLGPFRAPDSRALELVDIDLWEPVGKVDLVSVRIAPTGDPKDLLGNAFADPNAGARTVDAKGFMAPRGRAFRVVVAYKIDGHRGGFAGLRITYHSGWFTRTGVLGQSASC